MGEYDFWRKEWKARAGMENPFLAAGASNFSRNPIEFLHNTAYIAETLKLNGRDSFLDVGCNMGLYCVAFAPWVKTVKGIDYIPEFVKEARKNCREYRNVRVKNGNILKIPYHAGSFDKILVNSVIQYLDDTDSVRLALSEIGRVMKRNGRALVTLTPDINKKSAYLRGIDKLRLPKSTKQVIHGKNQRALWLDPADFRALGRDVGLVSQILPPAKGVWQSWYMFNLLLKKV